MPPTRRWTSATAFGAVHCRLRIIHHLTIRLLLRLSYGRRRGSAYRPNFTRPQAIQIHHDLGRGRLNPLRSSRCRTRSRGDTRRSRRRRAYTRTGIIRFTIIRLNNKTAFWRSGRTRSWKAGGRGFDTRREHAFVRTRCVRIHTGGHGIGSWRRSKWRQTMAATQQWRHSTQHRASFVCPCWCWICAWTSRRSTYVLAQW